MYLYDKMYDKLDIYGLRPKEDSLYKYKIEEMKKIPSDKTIFHGVTNLGIENYKIFELYEDKFDSEVISMENANGSYHKLKTDSLINMGINKYNLLDFYSFLNLKDNKIARIQDLKKIRYFLLNQTKYITCGKTEVLKGIVEIPESLYLLSLIEQEKFSLLGNKSISEQLKLFKIELLKEIDLKSIGTMHNIGILPEGYSGIMKKAENDAYILEFIKNRQVRSRF